LCRHVLENQHKLQKFLQQQIRLCSRESVRAQPQFEEPTYDTTQPRIQKSDNAKYVLHSADTGTESLQIEHSPNVGQLFRVSITEKSQFKLIYFEDIMKQIIKLI